MKGHNYGLCEKCGTTHLHHRYWLGKRQRSPSAFQKGQIPWNKGLTKETDPRVKDYGLKVSSARKGVPMFPNGRPPFSITWKARIRLARFRQRFPNKGTRIERLLVKQLSHRGLIPERRPALPGQPDIVLGNVAVFCDGCYWHSCPKHYPRGRSRGNEQKINAELEQLGFKVLRFWEHDILSNSVLCVDRIVMEACSQ